MTKFRKKPVVIEAIQWSGSKHQLPTLIQDFGCKCFGNTGPDGIIRLVIPTLEGDMRVEPKDWIIKGVKGEFYPCKPEIFEMTYEKVEE